MKHIKTTSQESCFSEWYQEPVSSIQTVQSTNTDIYLSHSYTFSLTNQVSTSYVSINSFLHILLSDTTRIFFISNSSVFLWLSTCLIKSALHIPELWMTAVELVHTIKLFLQKFGKLYSIWYRDCLGSTKVYIQYHFTITSNSKI
jgi:hypothetical protein